jgi:DnaJ-class molecular chaperone
MEDPYQTLGVKRGDSEETIRAAYRKLAKRHHPDLNPNDPKAAARFTAINVANDLLSDPDKRAKFDRGEIDAEGNPTMPEPPPYRRRASEYGAGGRGGAGAGAGAGMGAGISPEDLDELFGQSFAFGKRRGGPTRGTDAQYSLTVDFLDAANGTVQRLTMPDGRTLDVTIPAGLQDGHVLRLRGQGHPGFGGGAAGDALVEVSVSPHKLFKRVGDDVHIVLPVSLQEAVLGATIEAPTVKGSVRMSIPPRSTTGTTLRLRGRGIAGGNQIVELKVMLPPEEEPALAEFLRGWKPKRPFDPRRDLAGAGEGATDKGRADTVSGEP